MQHIGSLLLPILRLGLLDGLPALSTESALHVSRRGEKCERGHEFRAEAFNIFNIQNWAPPADPSGITVGQAGFGRITTLAGVPRTLQLGLRILF